MYVIWDLVSPIFASEDGKQDEGGGAPPAEGAADDQDDAGSKTENHHMLPNQFKGDFEGAGLDINDYTTPMSAADHRLRPNGIHTGDNNYNKQWREFFKKHEKPTTQEILKQLERMKTDFNLPAE